MLVLSRKVGEQVVIGDDIRVMVVSVRGDRVRLGFTAPGEVPVHRDEVHRRMAEAHHGTGPPESEGDRADFVASERPAKRRRMAANRAAKKEGTAPPSARQRALRSGRAEFVA